ncbi:MAG: ECF-type sigma factor [Acidobacteriota bacterium]
MEDAPPETPPQDSTPSEVTRLLVSWRDGDAAALDRLVPLVYEELRRLAHFQMSEELGGRTLKTTALVHELYLKLVDLDVDWQCRAHFFAVASRQMRRILVDEARRKLRKKRGGERPLSLDQLPIEPQLAAGQDLLDLNVALERLGEIYGRQLKVIEMRLFGGLTIQETAEVLDVSAATVERELMKARAWLTRELSR